MMGARSSDQSVTIRGVTYDSPKAAAAEFGLHPNTVRTARRNGTLERVGTGRTGVEPMRVRIDGQDFDDVHAAAAHFGVAVMTVYAAIADGDPDRIARPPSYNPWKSRPFEVGGITFPSMRDASRKLGFKNPEYIAKAIKQKSKRGRERILAAAMRYAARGGA